MYEDKVAIVTGGASGIGKEMGLYLAERGTRVIIADINTELADEVAAEIADKGSEYLHWEKNQRDKTRFPTAKECIKPMMREIEKNRAIIVAPKSQKIYWWVYRFFPELILIFWRRVIKKMKE